MEKSWQYLLDRDQKLTFTKYMTVVKVKKQKGTKKVCYKTKLNFENCLEATKLQNKMKYLEENKININ